MGVGTPITMDYRFAMPVFQGQETINTAGLAERMVLLFERDAKNFSNSVRSEHFCFEYFDWREALLSCSKRLSMA